MTLRRISQIGFAHFIFALLFALISTLINALVLGLVLALIQAHEDDLIALLSFYFFSAAYVAAMIAFACTFSIALKKDAIGMRNWGYVSSAIAVVLVYSAAFTLIEDKTRWFYTVFLADSLFSIYLGSQVFTRVIAKLRSLLTTQRDDLALS